MVGGEIVKVRNESLGGLVMDIFIILIVVIIYRYICVICTIFVYMCHIYDKIYQILL